MNDPIASEVARKITARFIARTARSQAHHERARRYLPGGETRSITFYPPHPVYMVNGQGCSLKDADGNQYLDFLNNYTSLVHGHAHPPTVAAVHAELGKGTLHGSPAVVQYELAEHLCGRVPGLELVRFTSSGTEATMLAMRAARAFTGREAILKMHGAYHGTHDVAVAGDPAPRGTPDFFRRAVEEAPFNDLGAAERVLGQHSERIAAIVVEPVPNASGLTPPEPGYLQGLRALADRHQALLIFDEIVTLRLHPGGYQALAGVKPDLSTFGKIIGGGFAVGAFGGRREIMMQFEPGRADGLSHSGTFNGHNVTMAAGLCTLRALDEPAIDRINALGERLALGFEAAFRQAKIRGSITRSGSLVQVHWREGPIHNAAEVADGIARAGELPHLLHLELMNRGIYAAPRGELNVSTAMQETEVDRAINAFGEALGVLLPPGGSYGSLSDG